MSAKGKWYTINEPCGEFELYGYLWLPASMYAMVTELEAVAMKYDCNLSAAMKVENSVIPAGGHPEWEKHQEYDELLGETVSAFWLQDFPYDGEPRGNSSIRFVVHHAGEVVLMNLKPPRSHDDDFEHRRRIAYDELLLHEYTPKEEACTQHVTG